MKEFLEKVNFEKYLQMTKNHENLPSMQRVKAPRLYILVQTLISVQALVFDLAQKV